MCPDVTQHTPSPPRPFNVNVELSIYEKVAKAVLSLKTGKAAGFDLMSRY